MKTSFNRKARRGCRGFTIIEMSMGLVMAMAVAGTVVLMLQQHLMFIQILERFRFLRDDAPTIGLLLNRIVQQADTYRVYPSVQAAKSRSSATTVGGSAVWLRFRNPDGEFEQVIIGYDDQVDAQGLNFYRHSGTSWDSTPSWTLTNRPTDVLFENDSGVLLITLVGPNQEQVTYAGMTQ